MPEPGPSPRRAVFGTDRLSWPRLLRMVPAHVLNGIAVALGVAMVQLVVGSIGGFVAALTASSGAIFASLADQPTAPWRTWRRVATGATVGCVASLIVVLVRPYPAWMGVMTTGLSFVAMLAMAWGPRAGPIAFVPILALIFTMAAPIETGWQPVLEHVAWTALGALLYVGWAFGTSTLLQPRLQTLALAGALDGTSALLRSRAGLLVAADPLSAQGDPPLQAWIQRQAALDERLQSARDLLFAVPDIDAAATPKRATIRRDIALLLLSIDLRDNLLASEVDLDLLGHDRVGEALRHALSTNLHDIADALDGISRALRFGRPLTAIEPVGRALALRDAMPRPGADDAPKDPAAGDPAAAGPAILRADGADSAPAPSRPALVQSLLNRANHMVLDLGRMQATMRGDAVTLPLNREQLQLFVSPEGWPLGALKPHMTLASPVMRHALRVGVALGSAYLIADALPWASHPHWLVLSVAVVLRGNLEQTLARRDARVAGTTIGCLLVALLARFASPGISTVVFLVSIGVAHSFVLRRYLFAAIAATLMALLQAHLVHPDGGYGVGERLADTILGAALAWGFSYMLPWWERRSIASLVPRVLRGLATLAVEAMRWPEPGASDLQLRLARRGAYEAISGIAAAAQRTAAEPSRVRVPLYALAGLLTQSHVLLAHLAAIRSLLIRRASELDRADAEERLSSAASELKRLLAVDAVAPFDLTSILHPGSDIHDLPAAADVIAPWLDRRLQITLQAAARVAEAARALRAAV